MYLAGIRPYYLSQRNSWIKAYKKHCSGLMIPQHPRPSFTLLQSVSQKPIKDSCLYSYLQKLLSFFVVFRVGVNLYNAYGSLKEIERSSKFLIFQFFLYLSSSLLKVFCRQLHLIRACYTFWTDILNQTFGAKQLRERTFTKYLVTFTNRPFDYFHFYYERCHADPKASLQKKHYLILRQTRTNLYVTFTDAKGNVVYAISSGQLGIRNKWSRLWGGTFGLLVDKLFVFLLKYKITRRFDFMLYSHRRFKSYVHMLKKRLRRYKLRVDSWNYMIPYIHGHVLRQRRIKRL